MSNNQEKIDQLNLTKQRINEGAAPVRKQIDEGVLPILDPDKDSEAISIVKDAKQLYNELTKESKAMIDQAIETFSPSPLYKLPLELTYHKLEQQITPSFFPENLFINDMADEDWINFLNWIAKNQLGNSLRCFSWGGWEPFTFNRIEKPFIQDNQGKYDVFEFNPKYLQMLDNRIESAAERRITIVLTMIDNCSLKTQQPGHWRMSYWNGDNNINGTSNWAGMLYHWYELENQTEGWEETRDALNNFIKFMVRRYMKYYPYIIIELGNEIAASVNYAVIYSDLLDEVKPDGWDKFLIKYKQNSVNNEEWIKSKNIEKYFNMSIHGIGSLNAYHDKRDNIAKPGIKYVYSGDGRAPTGTPRETEELTEKILNDANRGAEFQLRNIYEFKNGWESVLGNEDWTMQTLMTPPEAEWFYAIKRGWFKHLGI